MSEASGSTSTAAPAPAVATNPRVVELGDLIKKQGEVVRKLKADKAEKSVVST